MTVASPDLFNINCLLSCKTPDTLLTKIESSAYFAALLIIGVMANGAPKRGLGANDDVLITVSAMRPLPRNPCGCLLHTAQNYIALLARIKSEILISGASKRHEIHDKSA